MTTLGLSRTFAIGFTRLASGTIIPRRGEAGSQWPQSGIHFCPKIVDSSCVERRFGLLLQFSGVLHSRQRDFVPRVAIRSTSRRNVAGFKHIFWSAPAASVS